MLWINHVNNRKSISDDLILLLASFQNHTATWSDWRPIQQSAFRKFDWGFPWGTEQEMWSQILVLFLLFNIVQRSYHFYRLLPPVRTTANSNQNFESWSSLYYCIIGMITMPKQLHIDIIRATKFRELTVLFNEEISERYLFDEHDIEQSFQKPPRISQSSIRVFCQPFTCLVRNINKTTFFRIPKRKSTVTFRKWEKSKSINQLWRLFWGGAADQPEHLSRKSGVSGIEIVPVMQNVHETELCSLNIDFRDNSWKPCPDQIIEMRSIFKRRSGCQNRFEHSSLK
jgi:hypothetical protein